MIRILQILDNLNIQSGVSSVVMNYYRNINKNKFQFDFLVFRRRSNSYDDEIIKLGGNIYYLPDPLTINGLLKIKEIENFFSEIGKNYRIIHLHASTLAPFIFPFASKYNIQHRIIHSHSSLSSASFIKRFINYVLNSLGKRQSTYYCTCSEEAGKYLFGNTTKEITFVNNAINLEKFYFDKDKKYKYKCDLGFKSSNKVCVHVSNFNPIKNHMFLIDVINKCIAKDNNIRFIFVGDGETRKTFENNLEARGLLEYCIFIGYSKDVTKYLLASDICVLPSIKEGLPVTIVEAEACGLNCIVSESITKQMDLGWIRYLPLDSDVWANTIIEDEIPSDELRCKRMERVKQSDFNIDNAKYKLEDYYDSILDLN